MAKSSDDYSSVVVQGASEMPGDHAARGGGSVHFRVTVERAAPGGCHGANIDVDGDDVVIGQPLDQLVGETDRVVDRASEILFLTAVSTPSALALSASPRPDKARSCT